MPRVTTGQFSGCWLNHAGGPNWTIKNPSSLSFERRKILSSVPDRPMERFPSFEIDFHQRKTTSSEIMVHKKRQSNFFTGARIVKLSQINPV